MSFALFMPGHIVGQMFPKGWEPGESEPGCLGMVCPTIPARQQSSRGIWGSPSSRCWAPPWGHGQREARPGHQPTGQAWFSRAQWSSMVVRLGKDILTGAGVTVLRDLTLGPGP